MAKYYRSFDMSTLIPELKDEAANIIDTNNTLYLQQIILFILNLRSIELKHQKPIEVDTTNYKAINALIAKANENQRVLKELIEKRNAYIDATLRRLELLKERIDTYRAAEAGLGKILSAMRERTLEKATRVEADEELQPSPSM